jgi:hypothetical protein
MHYNALCTSCIALFNCGHLLHMWVHHVEQKSEIQAERVQKEYDGPQASSCEVANLFVIKTSPSASHRILDFPFELISLY